MTTVAPYDPNDCALVVIYRDDGLAKPRLWLARAASSGAYHQHVDFDLFNYDVKVKTPPFQTGHRFAIAFILPEKDTTGGFAGVKIWPDGDKEPDEFLLSFGTPDGLFKIKNTPFDLDCFKTSPEVDPEKVTVMSLGDTCEKTATFRYCIGVYPTREARQAGGPIVREDPRVYNTGDVGDGCLGAFWKIAFGLAPRRSGG